MQARGAGSPVIHLFEPSGYGGVFQHTCRLAHGLVADGRKVVLHTSITHEEVTLGSIEVCPCVWWPRPSNEGPVGSAVRRARIAGRLVTRTVPHLARTPPGVLHVQGVAATGAVNLLAMNRARRAGHRVVYSPHDVFSRRGALEGALLRRAYRVPEALVVYSRADERRLADVAGNVAPILSLIHI